MQFKLYDYPVMKDAKQVFVKVVPLTRAGDNLLGEGSVSELELSHEQAADLARQLATN